MPPSGLAILIGAGPTSGAGIARILASPQHGNMAVALLARNPDNLSQLARDVSASSGGIARPFPCDTQPDNLARTFAAIAAHPEFAQLKLRLSIFHVKHSSKKPLLDETPAEFERSLAEYATGALAFAQESLRLMYAQHGGQTRLADTQGVKKGTIIFTGTLGALRTNVGYAAYGATRASARSIAQAVAKEHSEFGVQCVHAIANGPIRDETGAEVQTGRRMSGEAVGKTYLWLSEQEPTLWVHELDLRPALEKF